MTIDSIRSRSAGVGDAQAGYVLMALVRPAAPYLAWVALRIGLKPRQVTYLSGALACLIVALAASGGRERVLAALALIVGWELLDVTDGTMARALERRDNYGGFLDYAGGMIIVAFLPLALGIGAYAAPDGSLVRAVVALQPEVTVPRATVLIAGALISVISLFMRLLNRVLFLRFGDSHSQWDSRERWPPASAAQVADLAVRNLETLGGLQAIVLLGAAWFNGLELALAAYVAFYAGVFLAFIVTTHRRYRGRSEYCDVTVRPRAS
jgi:phosphatidylglycerophosphate synthase